MYIIQNNYGIDWPYKFNKEIYLRAVISNLTLGGGIIKNMALSQGHNALILLIKTSSRQVIST